MAIGLALLGIVWFTIAGYTWLSSVIAEPLAMCAVGFLCLAPLIVLLLRRKPSASRSPEAEQKAPDPPGDDVSAVVRLAHSASALAEKSPVAGIVLTLGAALLATRSPATAPLAIHMLAETVERWSRPVSPKSPDESDK
ncbi:MAG: hypothetical protein NW200_10150 [Hyphomonadaceae bacterium]|nr:hypothetical protein [Hyphomonadaceae bacterium]